MVAARPTPVTKVLSLNQLHLYWQVVSLLKSSTDQKVVVDVVCCIEGYVTTFTCPAASDYADSAPAGEAGATVGEAEPQNE